MDPLGTSGAFRTRPSGTWTARLAAAALAVALAAAPGAAQTTDATTAGPPASREAALGPRLPAPAAVGAGDRVPGPVDPVRFDGEPRRLWPTPLEWTFAGAAIAGVALGDGGLEEELWSDRPDRIRGVARVTSALGSTPAALALVGGTWGVGYLADADGVRKGAGRATIALAVATGIDQILKGAIGRARPDATDDPAEFRPGSYFDNSHNSFPSGHAVTAFSLATSIAEETDEPWLAWAAYGTAGTVAYARVYRHRHWPSDVVAGALLGVFSTRATLRWLESRTVPGVDEAAHASARVPAVSLEPGGLALTWSLP